MLIPSSMGSGLLIFNPLDPTGFTSNMRYFPFDISGPYKRLRLFLGFYLEKCGIFWKNSRFSGRIWPDWGNTVRADTAGLGSIGLIHSQEAQLDVCRHPALDNFV